jgi:hypothetical protein
MPLKYNPATGRLLHPPGGGKLVHGCPTACVCADVQISLDVENVGNAGVCTDCDSSTTGLNRIFLLDFNGPAGAGLGACLGLGCDVGTSCRWSVSTPYCNTAPAQSFLWECTICEVGDEWGIEVSIVAKHLNPDEAIHWQKFVPRVGDICDITATLFGAAFGAEDDECANTQGFPCDVSNIVISLSAQPV